LDRFILFIDHRTSVKQRPGEAQFRKYALSGIAIDSVTVGVDQTPNTRC